MGQRGDAPSGRIPAISYTAPAPAGYAHHHAVSTLFQLHYPLHALPISSATYPTADLAIYCPLIVERRTIVLKLYVCNGSAVSGNFDLGLYDAAGTRLVSTGATAQSGTSTEQVVDVTDTTIGPGVYYIAVVLDNTTGTMLRDADAAPLCASYGVLTEQLAASGTLPATATWTVNQTLAYLPSIGCLVEATVA